MTGPTANLTDAHLPLELLQEALRTADGERAVREALLDAPPGQAVHAVALGKAAAAMARGAGSALGPALRRALVVSRDGYLDAGLCADERFTCLESDHPVPGERSLHAGAALLQFIDATPEDHSLLFLISGGTSSLVEVPVDGVDAGRLAQLNTWLLGAGLDIATMNRMRTALSCIKGGRLARRVAGRAVTALLISDVPGDDPAVIGSGLLVAGEAAGRWPDVPAALSWVNELSRPPLRPGEVELPSLRIVADLGGAMEAVVKEARGRGLPAFRHAEFLDGEAGATGAKLAAALLRAEPGVHVWGGETHVHLPDDPGRGGRNQHLALAAARVLAGTSGVRLLAAGTDGSDGSSDDAGALVDGGTVARGEAAGLDAQRCLERADSGRFLAASGDLIHTGPTGTNVMDLVIGVVSGSQT